MGYAIEPLEIAVGRVIEPQRSIPPLAVRGRPREVLESLITEAFEAGPVSVSFSGGRDSSLILAVATHVARREGFPDPLPITMRHASPDSQEDEWQDLVIGHLGLGDWIRFDVGDDLDVLGPRATAILRITGIQSPPNAYMHLPMLERAEGGVLLTGAGGDEILATKGNPLARALWGNGRLLGRRQAQSALLAASPAFVRRCWRRREVVLPPWLTQGAREDATLRMAREMAHVHLRWDHIAWLYATSRTVVMGQLALDRLAETRGARVLSPLLTGAFVGSFAHEVGPQGPSGRTASMRLLAADLLPASVIERASKATFGAVLWGPAFREFAQCGVVDGVQPGVAELVDLDQVAQHWRSDVPTFASIMLLQDAWLGRTRPT